jgi:hypothetical protein
MDEELDVRPVVNRLLMTWESGARERQVFEDARALWLSRRWPQAHEKDYHPAALDVLFMLASARDAGLTDADIPALRSYASAKGPRTFDRARDRFFEHIEATSREREVMQARDDYYGPRPADEDEQWEFPIADPDGRRLHRHIRLDPEAGWDELSARMCAPGPRDEPFLTDLLEDLVFWHAERFIDRLERLVEECPESREIVAHAHVGGVASSRALERFWSLRERLAIDLEG